MSRSSNEASGAGYALAYREARRGLEDQERSVVELRNRAATLIAAAAVITSFFGSQTLARHDLDAAGWVAIGCFALLSFAVLVVLWPRRDWSFSLAPAEFIVEYLEPPDGEPLESHLIERDLALHMGRSTLLNRDQLDEMASVFRVAALLLVVEVLAWIVALVAAR